MKQVQAVLRASNLHKRFGDHPVLNGISFEVKAAD